MEYWFETIQIRQKVQGDQFLECGKLFTLGSIKRNSEPDHMLIGSGPMSAWMRLGRMGKRMLMTGSRMITATTMIWWMRNTGRRRKMVLRRGWGSVFSFDLYSGFLWFLYSHSLSLFLFGLFPDSLKKWFIPFNQKSQNRDPKKRSSSKPKSKSKGKSKSIISIQKVEKKQLRKAGKINNRDKIKNESLFLVLGSASDWEAEEEEERSKQRQIWTQ